MVQTLLMFAGLSLLAISAATLFVAVRALRTAREYVDLAEQRLEQLREGQARLVAQMEQQRRVAREHQEAEPDVSTRRGAGESIERTKQELLGLRAAVGQPPAGSPEARERPENPPPGRPRKPERARPPADLPETRSSGSGSNPGEDQRTRRAVWRPHPDDDVRPGSTLAGQVRTSGGFPIQMFRVFYDRYLDNYEGYVKLAERIHQARTEEETVRGSRAEREWQERLHRVNDGIARTTERLDILEHSNPELASDDRVSRRATIAREHARITE